MAPGARGYALLAWIIVFTVLCLVVLTLRAWAAVVAKRKFYADDAFVIFAFANTIALEGVAIWAIWHGLGKHTDQVSKEDFAVQFKLILAADATWLLGTVFIKFSVLWLYTRIFCVQAFKRWSYTLIGIVAAYGVAFFILFMSRCVPASYQWHPTPGGHCRDIYLDQVTSVSINMVIDIAIVALPLPVLWNLQLAVRSKIAVTVMFSIGLLTIGIMIWRLHFTVTTRYDKDFVWNLYNVGLISFLELWLGIIVACIPTLAPLLKTYVKPAITKMTQRSTRSNARTGKDSLGSTADSRIAKPISSRQYSQLDEPSKSHLIEQEMHELNGANVVTTNCHYDPRTTPLPVYQQEGIYIQRDVVATRYE